jgi:hypothetical protein
LRADLLLLVRPLTGLSNLFGPIQANLFGYNPARLFSVPDPLRRRENMGIRDSERKVHSNFTTDGEGNPTGGSTVMLGSDGIEVIEITWQDGIVGSGGQNGAFIEDVLEAARQRLQFFNGHPRFRCRENSLAITKIEEALQWLDWRTRQRLAQGVENTYESHESA